MHRIQNRQKEHSLALHSWNPPPPHLLPQFCSPHTVADITPQPYPRVFAMWHSIWDWGSGARSLVSPSTATTTNFGTSKNYSFFNLFERDHISASLFPYTYNGWDWATPKPGGENSVQASHVVERKGPSYLSHQLLSPRVCLSRKWSQDSRPGTLLWKAGILIRVLIIRANDCSGTIGRRNRRED